VVSKKKNKMSSPTPIVLSKFSQSSLHKDDMPFSKEDLQNKTVPVLRQFCKECGLGTTGTHSSFVDKILAFQSLFYKNVEKKNFPLFSDLPKSSRDMAIALLISNYLPPNKDESSVNTGFFLEGKQKKLIWIDRENLQDNQIYDISTAQTKTAIEWLTDLNIKGNVNFICFLTEKETM